jgi:hypothetical protein
VAIQGKMLARYTRSTHTLLPRLRTIASQANSTDRSHLVKAGLRPCSELRPLVIFDHPIHPHQPSLACRPMSGVMRTAASDFSIATCLPPLKSGLKNHNLLPHSQESTTDNTLSQHHVETTERWRDPRGVRDASRHGACEWTRKSKQLKDHR